jgi:hypothetical protein
LLEDLDQDRRLVESNAALSATTGLGGCFNTGRTYSYAGGQLPGRRLLGGASRCLLGRRPRSSALWCGLVLVLVFIVVVFVLFFDRRAAALFTGRRLFVLILVIVVFVLIVVFGLGSGPTLFTDRRWLFLVLLVVGVVGVDWDGTTTAGGRFGCGPAARWCGVYVVVFILIGLFGNPISPTRCGLGTSAACGAATYFGHVMAPLKVYV